MIDIHLRKVNLDKSDRNKLIDVESKSTPNLRYVPHVFETFATDPRGEFSIAEVDGAAVGCAKFTVTPEQSAWVETLRVIPERQGLGIGKRLYERFFEVAKQENVTTMRMYTGINNVVSKGLAEHFGFRLESTFLGASRPTVAIPPYQVAGPNSVTSDFKPVTNRIKATELLMAHKDAWNDFLVMNRTFYKLTPELCVHLAKQGFVYENIAKGSVVVLGARFMPEQALHIGQFAGDADACIQLALEQASASNIPTLSCLYPDTASEITAALARHDFTPNASKFIVMRVDL